MIKLRLTALAAAVLMLGACSPRTMPVPQLPDASSLPLSGLSQPAESADLSKMQEPMLASLENSASLADTVIPVAETTESSYDLSFPQTFAITRPTEKISTTFSSYFITGTSDPKQPVFYGDTEITRQGTKGVFGVLVNLNMGNNSFTFRQGDKTETVTITRTQQTVSKISAIVQSSMYPATYGSAKAGGDLLLECTAPAGAKVTATFEDQTVTLKQAAEATAGIPAVFRGSMTVGTDYPEDETTKVGKITYTLTYGGKTTKYESTGNVYIAGENSRIAVRVTGYIGFLYNNTTSASSFREKLKGGSTDYVESQDNSYYKLASGGYLPTSSGEIIEGRVNIRNQVDSVSFSSHSNNETYTFIGTKTPVFLTATAEGTFTLTLYNTAGTPSIDVSNSRLFGKATAVDNGSSVSYTFTQKSAGNLWGYNVAYDGNNTVLRFAYKPSLKEGETPLSGVTIVLDPGHGKDDSGAFGVPGKTGPDENLLNMVYANATKKQLEAKGAKVLLTRSNTNEFLELNERLEFFENSGADMYVSIHHNSLAESADANKVSGMEIYYHGAGSQNFANRFMSGLASNMSRTNRGVIRSYFRVTMLPYAPSILCELGYLCNPLEYENITTQSQVDKTATALTEAVINTLRRS